MRFFGLVVVSVVLIPCLTAQTEAPPSQGFQWQSAILESLEATAIAHTVRVTTESDTQSELGGSFWTNYFHSIENVHGFDDGDALYTTWILHPMEGAAAGFIEQQNDPAYRDVEFGNTQRYWISCMRALAFSAAYSTQWTLGLASEASIGNVQHFDPPGVDDLVVTPILGIGWMVGEDTVDRYVIRWIEARSQNRIIRLLARSTLNPMRSYANILRFQEPWHRDSRGGFWCAKLRLLRVRPYRLSRRRNRASIRKRGRNRSHSNSRAARHMNVSSAAPAAIASAAEEMPPFA